MYRERKLINFIDLVLQFCISRNNETVRAAVGKFQGKW